MVRIMMVRHAESVQNAYMESLMRKMYTGGLSLEDFNKSMRDGPPGTSAGDDAQLSPLGETQAESLGQTWSPLLESKAKAGKLITFVSPFLRTLQTADPLMKRLAQAVPGYRAVLLPAIMEAGGLTNQDDFKKFDEIEALVKQGKRKEAIAFLKSIDWKPQGMTAKQIRERFAWARTANGSDSGVVSSELYSAVPEDSPWHKGGYESRKHATQRVEQVAKWLVSLASNSNTGDDVVVLLVAHGQTIEMTANMMANVALTGHAEESPFFSMGGIRNTSITSYTLPSSNYTYAGERPDVNGQINKYRAKLDFFNDTSHLGDEQLRFFAQNFLSAKL